MSKNISLKAILIAHAVVLVIGILVLGIISSKETCSGFSFLCVTSALLWGLILGGLWAISLFICLMFYVLTKKTVDSSTTEAGGELEAKPTLPKFLKVIILLELFLIGFSLFPYILLFIPYALEFYYYYLLRYLAPLLAVISTVKVLRLRKALGLKNVIWVLFFSVMTSYVSYKGWLDN